MRACVCVRVRVCGEMRRTNGILLFRSEAPVVPEHNNQLPRLYSHSPARRPALARSCRLGLRLGSSRLQISCGGRRPGRPGLTDSRRNLRDVSPVFGQKQHRHTAALAVALAASHLVSAIFWRGGGEQSGETAQQTAPLAAIDGDAAVQLLLLPLLLLPLPLLPLLLLLPLFRCGGEGLATLWRTAFHRPIRLSRLSARPIPQH